MKAVFSCLLILLLTSFAQLRNASVVDCDFESTANQWCGWTDLSPISPFVLTNSPQIDPGHDHTCHDQTSPRTKCGHWLTTTTTTTNNTSMEFALVSAQISPTTVATCFTLWYHLFGKDHNLFEVLVSAQPTLTGAVPHRLWTKRSAQSTNWIRAQVAVPVQPQPFHLILRAIHWNHLKQNAAQIGVDDLVFTRQSCPPPAECDLESGDLCRGWTSVGTVLTEANRKSTVPSKDHTVGAESGHYLRASGDNHTATITTPSLATMFPTLVSVNDSTVCLKFWYYLSADYRRDRASYIRVGRHRTLAIEQAYSDAVLNGWKPMAVTIPMTADSVRSPITITLFTGSGSSISVDDLLVHRGPCEHSGQCNFESDFCGYTAAGGHWFRSQAGGQRDGVQEPPVDSTTGTAVGWFVVAPIEHVATATWQLASLTSAALWPPPNTSRTTACFRLAYYAVAAPGFGSSPVFAATVRLTDLTTDTEHWSVVLNASASAEWIRFAHTFEELPPRFTIGVETLVQSVKLASDVAVDDIQLTSGACRNESGHHLPSTPTPAKPETLPSYKWDCGFENEPTCAKWRYDSNWIRTSYRSAPTGLSALPHTDHSSHTPEGGFLLWMPNGADGSSNSTTTGFLNSTEPLPGAQWHCLTAWYYDETTTFGEDFQPYELTVLARTANFTLTLLTVNTGLANTGTWKQIRQDVYTYTKEGPVIVLRLRTAAHHLRGAFAIDQLKLVPDKCGHPDGDYLYTFDQGSVANLGMRRLAPLHSVLGTVHYPRWHHTYYPNAPTADHTTGHGRYLLFANLPADLPTTWVNHVTLPLVVSSVNSTVRCVRFAYQRVGEDTGLRVFVGPTTASGFIQTDPVFTAHAQHSEWVMAHVQYRAEAGDRQLVVAVTKRTDRRSFVAIDDLQVLGSPESKCVPPVECDFGEDLCAYSALNQNETDHFVRFVAPATNQVDWHGPPYDHTTPKSIGGGYIYLSGYPHSKLDLPRSGSLISPVVEIRSQPMAADQCLIVWTQLTGADASLTVAVTVFRANTKQPPINTTTTLAELTTSVVERDWTRHLVDLSHRVLDGGQEYLIRFTATTDKARTVVALDDISLLHGACVNHK